MTLLPNQGCLRQLSTHFQAKPLPEANSLSDNLH